jgi:hypothetical protein
MKMEFKPTRRNAIRAFTALASTTVLGAAMTTAARADSGNGGAFLLVTHKVDDFDRWLAVFESTRALKRKYGWKQSSVFSVDGDRNHVMVLEEFGSLERAKAFAASPELKAAMGKAGVSGPPEIRFVSMVSRAKA